MSGNLTFVSLAAGAAHTCGLTSLGAAYCWGDNHDGELGTTTNNGTNTPNPTPQAVSGGHAFVALAAGGETYSTHSRNWSCAITSTGDAYCWGRTRSASLATAPTAARETRIRRRCS